MVTIKNVTNDKKGMKDFINLVYDLYRDEPNWTPPLKMMMKEFFHPKKGPFFAHGEVAFFVGYIDGIPLGRVTAQIDHTYDKKYNVRQGAFGFYESQNDPEMARDLMAEVEKWLKDKNCDNCIGPMNFCGNDDNMGFLLEGHERTNAVMLTWTKKYYPALFETLGYQQEKILVSYVLENVKKVPDIVTKWKKRLEQRFGDSIEIKKITKKNMLEYGKICLHIYNEAWTDNWGFVPMTDFEIENMLNDIKQIADLNLLHLIYKNNEPAACLIGIPDINQLLVNNRNGNLTPKIMWNFLFGFKKINNLRVIIMGVKPKFRNLGLDFLLYNEIFSKPLQHTNYRNTEMGWVVESNSRMLKILERLGAKVANRFLVVNKEL